MNATEYSWYVEPIECVLAANGLTVTESRFVAEAVADIASYHVDVIPYDGRPITMGRLARMFFGVDGTPVFTVGDLEFPTPTLRRIVDAFALWRSRKPWPAHSQYPDTFPHEFGTLAFHSISRPRPKRGPRSKAVKP